MLPPCVSSLFRGPDIAEHVRLSVELGKHEVLRGGSGSCRRSIGIGAEVPWGMGSETSLCYHKIHWGVPIRFV